MKNEEYKYKITFDVKGLIMPAIFLIILVAVSIWLYKSNNGAYIFTGLFSVVMAAIMLYSIYSVLFKKILIGENSFTHKKGPGKSQTYEYSEISEAWESTGKGTNGAVVHYFNYKTAEGNVNKFIFYPYQYDEVDYLLAKINGEDVIKNE